MSTAIDISLFEPTVTVTSSAGVPISLGAAVRPGLVITAQHEILIGLSMVLLLPQGNPSAILGIAPTYRFHLQPMRPMAFSPFVQGEIFVNFAISNGAGGSPSIPFGLSAAVGGEYLFSRNMGVVAWTGIRFTHVMNGTTFGGTTAADNLISLLGAVALSLHF
jgi:hypothetical protein